MIGRKPEIKWTKDGRLILSGKAYHDMRLALCELANCYCEADGCGKPTRFYDGEAHHEAGRGGGRRDDRIFIDGKRNLKWLCKSCHGGEHVPAKVVPKKPSPQEFKEMLGLGAEAL